MVRAAEHLCSLPSFCAQTLAGQGAEWHPDKLDEGEQMDHAAYCLTRDVLPMLRQRQRERPDTWLLSVHQSNLSKLERFAHGVDLNQAALTLPITDGQVASRVTWMKLIKRMMYGKADFALLRQRVLHRI
ncbi:MAG TPA: hypothetical protein VGF67_03300 [Ktedonobacteraceae bacterium]